MLVKSHPLYVTLRCMYSRCYNQSNNNYNRYGGRGITVCSRWKGPGAVFRFASDMGPKPSPEHTVDRVDNNGPYSPENCRWSSIEEQNTNRRDCVFLTHNGKSKTIAQWSRDTGLDYGTIRSRIKYGWNTHDVLTRPIKQYDT